MRKIIAGAFLTLDGIMQGSFDLLEHPTELESERRKHLEA